MSAYVTSPAPRGLDGLTRQIDNIWKSILGDSTTTLGVDRPVGCELMPHPHAYPDITLRDACGWGPPRHSRDAPTTEPEIPGVQYGVSLERQRRRYFQLKSSSEPPPIYSRRVNDVTPSSSAVATDIKSTIAKLESADGSYLLEDYSESSRSDDDSPLNTKTTRRGGTRRVTKMKKSSFSPGSKKPDATVHSETCHDDSSFQGAGCTQARRLGNSGQKRMTASKSEGCIPSTSKVTSPLPRMNRSSSRPGFSQGPPKHRKRTRLPPHGGQQPAFQNSATRHMEAQLAKLRESTSEKQALHDRVCSYLCYGSRRRAPGHGELRGGQDGISLASSNSSTSLTVKRKGVSRGVLKGHDCFKDGLSEYRRAMDHSERKMAQKLLAEEVRRRKRDKDRERLRHMECAVFQRATERRTKNQETERERVEAWLVVVTSALAFAEWQTALEEKRRAELLAKKQTRATILVQSTYRRLRARRSWVAVRKASPIVQKMIFRMLLRAAMAKEAVAKRRKREAADVIATVLRATTLTLFRRRMVYFSKKIVTCQRFVASFREISKARKKALALKWARQVGKLDKRRFCMYAANLRDMCNFDPKAVGTFLKEMRILAASAEEVAQRLKILPHQGHISPLRRNAAMGSGAGNSPRAKARAANNKHTEPRSRDGAALMTQRSQLVRLTPMGEQGASPTIAPIPAKITIPPKLVLGWRKRVEQGEGGNIYTQASLMSKRGVKHKEISRSLRNKIISGLLSQARRVHKEWFWHNVRAVRMRKRKAVEVNLADIKTALGTSYSPFQPTNDVLEAKIKAATAMGKGVFPIGEYPGMHLLNMITDDLLTRYIIFAERMEGCVSADESRVGTLSRNEMREIFVTNRHPSQHDTVAAKEAETYLHAWEKACTVATVAFSSGRTSNIKTIPYHAQQKRSKKGRESKMEEIPYFDFMDFVQQGILSDICVPDDQRNSVERSTSGRKLY